MCSPELARGICCICYGALRPETTLVDDLYEGRGGVHKGKCAILAGIIPEGHLAESDALIKRIHGLPPNSWARSQAAKAYHDFAERIAEANYEEERYMTDDSPGSPQ